MKPLLMDHGLMALPQVSDQPAGTRPENVTLSKSAGKPVPR